MTSAWIIELGGQCAPLPQRLQATVLQMQRGAPTRDAAPATRHTPGNLAMGAALYYCPFPEETLTFVAAASGLQPRHPMKVLYERFPFGPALRHHCRSVIYTLLTHYHIQRGRGDVCAEVSMKGDLGCVGGP